jgi:tripartite-type tricarboxylate transporter receptor subunit TctC
MFASQAGWMSDATREEKMKFARHAMVAFIAMLFAGHAHAQDWPTRPIKLIVPSGPGLGADVLARLMAERVSRQLGQQMFVENISGGAGMVGGQVAARAAPDGYTFYFGLAGALSSNLVLFKSVPYDPLRDFTPVAMVSESGPFVISVQSEQPFKTLADLIAYAKANPGKLSYGIDASSGYQVVVGQLLSKRAGIEMLPVPYRATAQVMQDTVSGTNPMMISAVAAVEGFVQSGKLRRLAITSGQRFPGLDDLPAVAETLPGFRVDGWLAVVAPAGTPEPIVARLNKEIDAFIKDPETQKRLLAMGFATKSAGTPASIRAFMASEIDAWHELAKELNIQPQ